MKEMNMNKQFKRRFAIPLLCVIASLGMLSAHAETYNLVVQPIQSQKVTRESYQPLADYLSKATGQDIKIVTAINFVAYWQTMRHGKKYDLVLDAAHLTDWRIKKMHYIPLAKISSVVSFTLVTHIDNPILGPEELIGKRVAVLSSPSMGAVRLAELFPNPLRQPVIVNVNDAQDAVKKIQEGKAVGAIIPSRMVGGFSFLNTVQSTAQVPHMAMSASSKVPPEVRDKIRKALIDAKNNPEGKKMLDSLNLEAFEPASPKMYDGYSKLLKGIYGY